MNSSFITSRPGHGTTYSIFILHRIKDKYLTGNKVLYSLGFGGGGGEC